MTPILRAIPEGGEPCDDPSEDQLFMLLEDIEDGQGSFLIVERTSDPSRQTYVQTARLEDGSYAVEHRKGSAERHFGTVVPDLRTAHGLLAGWAFRLAGWNESVEWTPITY